MPDQESNKYPDIPSKLYFTIGEVSELCDVKPSALRYWEQEFKQLQKLERRANRRYYKREDILFVRRVKELVHEQGYTINGARQHLAAQSKKPQASDLVDSIVYFDIDEIIGDLEEVKEILSSASPKSE